MKKILVFTALITAVASAAFCGPLDHFVVSLDLSATVTGVAKTVSLDAYDSLAIKTDYTGSAYLTVPGGGEVIVEQTGTNATPAFISGSWTGTIRILKAGAAVTVEAVDGTVTAATGISNAVAMLEGPYQKIKLIADNMIFTPGTVTGSAGSLSVHTTQQDFGVTVYACDEWYNPVVPGSITGIKIVQGFPAGSGYIAVTPACGPSDSYDLYAAGASSITFTASVWPNPNQTKPYSIKAVDLSRGLEDPLEISFISKTDYYFETLAPASVTAGVPFGVTVKVSHEVPPAVTPDITYIEQVRIKARNTSDSSDASPVLTNDQLTPYPTPAITTCAAGVAYFAVAMTKTGSIYIVPIPAGVKPFLNVNDPTSFSTYITVGAAQPATFSFTSGASRLERGAGTQLTVAPYDIFGNPVPDTDVNFTIVMGSGILSTGTAKTNGLGVATVNYTAPSGNFENIISASVPPVAAPKSVTVLSELTEKFQNWPNPFIAGKETTKINYSLPEDSAVSLRLYSSFGKLAWKKDIKKGEVDPVSGENHGKKGGNTVIWDGKGDRGFVLGAGVYILKMTITNSSGSSVKTRKIAIVK